MKTKYIYPLLLALVLLFSFFIRLYKLTSSPPSINWDETSIGYNAYSILKTGKDEWNKFLPLHFQSFGEYKLPAQIYASIPAIAVFGLTPFSVRITAVIYGTLTILFLYLLTEEITKNKKVSLIASILLSISPWHVLLTRISLESLFSVMWVVLGLWLLIKGFNGKKYWWILSMVPFVISVYTYNSARVFTPLFLVLVSVFYRKEILKNKKQYFISLILFFVAMLPLVPFVMSGEASARYKLVSITNDLGLIPRINEARGNSKLPFILNRLVINRYSYNGYYIGKNYFAHFTPSFLFIEGASHRQHHVQGMGELYYFQAIFMFFGIYLLFKERHKYLPLILIWLAIAFVPVATTKDSIPNALRTAIASPIYQIFTAYGLVAVWKIVNKKDKYIKYLFLSLVILSALFEFTHFYNILLNEYSKKYSKDWQYGYKEVVEYVKEHYSEYDEIVITRAYGEPHIFTLFYMQYSPEKFQTDKNLVRYQSNDWVWVTNFDKFYFPNLSDKGTTYLDIEKANPGKKILFVGKSGDFGGDVNLLKEVNFLDGTTAFKIVKK